MKYKTEEVIGKKVISPVGGAETNIPKKYTEQRPWGSFEQFNLNTPCTVKIIDVKPESQLSLQFHNHRNEFWRILKGECTVMLDNKNYIAEAGDEFIIPAKTLHRVTTHSQGVQFLEISYGHFDENDIIRLEDKYKRATASDLKISIGSKFGQDGGNGPKSAQI